MAKDNSSKATETTTAAVAPVSDAAAQLAAAKAAAKEQAEKERAQKRAVHGAQTQAREILGVGMSDLAKLARKFVASQGTDAAERTAELVKALQGVVSKF